MGLHMAFLHILVKFLREMFVLPGPNPLAAL
jgi:hypothetical protein